MSRPVTYLEMLLQWCGATDGYTGYRIKVPFLRMTLSLTCTTVPPSDSTRLSLDDFWQVPSNLALSHPSVWKQAARHSALDLLDQDD